MIKTNDGILSSLKTTIMSSEVADKYKSNPEDFTRNRKLSFPRLVVLLMSVLRKSLQIELHQFFSKLGKLTGSKSLSVSKSAFCQSRKKLKALFFEDLIHQLNQEFYTDNDERVKKWQGFRVLAVDGSIIELPYSEDLVKKYGTYSNQHACKKIQARLSVLYDVLNGFVIDGRLTDYSTGERIPAHQHLEYCTPGDLLIYDRGYPSFEFIHSHLERNLDFVMRVKLSFSKVSKAFVASGLASQVVEIQPGINQRGGKSYPKETSLQVRLVRVILDSGETEVLMTSLLEEEVYPSEIFKDLYFQRWKVETRYDVIKNCFILENFSGYSEEVVLQDFYIILLIANLQALLQDEVEECIQEKYQHRTYQYKTNLSVSVGLLKPRIVDLFFHQDMQTILEELRDIFVQYVEPIRPNRNFPRKKDQYRNKVRPKTIKNRKNIL